MPTKNLRINVVLKKPLCNSVQKDGVSVSLKVPALELIEDVALSIYAEKREKTFIKSKALKHNEVW